MRETTKAERQKAAQRRRSLELMRLHPGKSESEIAAMMKAGEAS